METPGYQPTAQTLLTLTHQKDAGRKKQRARAHRHFAKRFGMRMPERIWAVPLVSSISCSSTRVVLYTRLFCAALSLASASRLQETLVFVMV